MTIYQGKTKNFTRSVVDSDGDAQDLTGYTMYFTIKENLTDSDASALLIKEATISEPTSGIGAFEIEPDDTADIPTSDNYYYDIQLSKTGESHMLVNPTRLMLKEPVRDAV